MNAFVGYGEDAAMQQHAGEARLAGLDRDNSRSPLSPHAQARASEREPGRVCMHALCHYSVGVHAAAHADWSKQERGGVWVQLVREEAGLDRTVGGGGGGGGEEGLFRANAVNKEVPERGRGD